MRRFVIMTFVLLLSAISVMAAGPKASIKFESNYYDYGSFSEDDAVQKCIFVFTNVGDAPLVISQAVASCGCTVPKYTKKPVAPGEKGEIEVTYNGTGKFPGYFKKVVTVRTNGDPELTRIYIQGEMTESKHGKNSK